MRPLLIAITILMALTAGESWGASHATGTMDMTAGPADYKDSIIADYDTFVRLVEETHPDPYQNFGGRVFFHMEAARLRRHLLDTPEPSAADLYVVSSEFISHLRDGHSFINEPAPRNGRAGNDSLLLVKFICMDGSMVVNAIDSARSDLIGSRVIAINGSPIQEFLERVAVRHPCENRFGQLAMLCNWFRPVDFYRNILGTPDAEITLELTTPAGDTVRYSPLAVPYDRFGDVAKARAPKDDRFPSRQMEWKEIDGTMFFRLRNVEARENFEYQHARNLDFYDELAYYYRSNGMTMPADTLEAIKALPSLSETFLGMLDEMKSKGTDTLVIDLRGNGGGWTPIVYPTLFMLFGDRYLSTDMDARFYRRVSELYLKKLNTDISSFNKSNGLELKTGDYLLPDERPDTRTTGERRQDFIDNAFCGDSVKTVLMATGGKPVYTPRKIYVVTDESTFSAAFHYAFYLSRLGAVVAGETSSQAPDCYMEVTPFRLPLTGLTGSVSNAMQVFLPADDPRAREFTPEVTLSYDGYRRHGFDSESILIHLLE